MALICLSRRKNPIRLSRRKNPIRLSRRKNPIRLSPPEEPDTPEPPEEPDTPEPPEEPVVEEEPRAWEERTFSLLLGGASMEFVWIPAGTFQMGSPDTEEGYSPDEGPVHEVEISEGFYLGKYEITQGEWEAVMGGQSELL